MIINEIYSIIDIFHNVLSLDGKAEIKETLMKISVLSPPIKQQPFSIKRLDLRIQHISVYRQGERNRNHSPSLFLDESQHQSATTPDSRIGKLSAQGCLKVVLNFILNVIIMMFTFLGFMLNNI